MKDIIALSQAQDILEFINKQWRTDMFRTAATTPTTELAQLLDKFATLPRIFFRFSEPQLEKLHFTTWMGAMALRDEDWYENPYIADVFLLHEICHMALATYDHNLSFENWHNKMNMEEVTASVLSEVMVYFWMPHLRERTFADPIWADRFLNTHGHSNYLESPDKLQKTITELRICHMDPSFAEDADPEVRRIAQYGTSNHVWSNIWKDTFREIELHMTVLTYSASRNAGAALMDHVAWLKSKMTNGIPFREQAEAYAAHLKKVYDT